MGFSEALKKDLEDIKKDVIYNIIGELISKEKYTFVDGKVIASIVKDTVDILKEKQSKD